jgi:hypothetical protein
MEQWSIGKLILIPLIFFTTSFVKAQDKVLVEKQVEVGMWVDINACKSQQGNYVAMDLYKKTRYDANEIIKIDTASGEGVFEYFFTPGDFDAKRLPCIFGEKKYRVAALRVFETDGIEKRVMILYTADKLAVIWVEFDKAIELDEITWD